MKMKLPKFNLVIFEKEITIFREELPPHKISSKIIIYKIFGIVIYFQIII